MVTNNRAENPRTGGPLAVSLQFDSDTLRPLVAAVVAETLANVGAAEAVLPAGRLAFPEREAASLLGLQSHQLRDARLRGEITATKVGALIGYERTELLDYLARNRQYGRREGAK